MSVLITGGTGFIGSHSACRVAKSGEASAPWEQRSPGTSPETFGKIASSPLDSHAIHITAGFAKKAEEASSRTNWNGKQTLGTGARANPAGTRPGVFTPKPAAENGMISQLSTDKPSTPPSTSHEKSNHPR